MAASGKALVYTGYAWRGRSTVEGAAASSPEAPQAMREVMALSKDQNEFKGRWFWGAYQEFGIDVTMRRATSAPMITGVDQASLKAGASEVSATSSALFGGLACAMSRNSLRSVSRTCASMNCLNGTDARSSATSVVTC